MMLSRHRRFIPLLTRSSERSTRRCTYMSILDRFQIIQQFMQCISSTIRTVHYVVSSSVRMQEMTWYSRNNRRLWCSKAGHYLRELRKQTKIHKLCNDEPQEAQMPSFDLTQLERVHTKASSEIKRLGRLGSQRRMPRETERPPITMIDEKPTDETSTSKKDQDGHGMMKSENFSKKKKKRTQTTN